MCSAVQNSHRQNVSLDWGWKLSGYSSQIKLHLGFAQWNFSSMKVNSDPRWFGLPLIPERKHAVIWFMMLAQTGAGIQTSSSQTAVPAELRRNRWRHVIDQFSSDIILVFTTNVLSKEVERDALVLQRLRLKRIRSLETTEPPSGSITFSMFPVMEASGFLFRVEGQCG